MSSDKLTVFVSYSHKDDPRWLQRVQVHLKPLARVGQLDLWDDTRIKSGDRWRQQIKDALARAEVAGLLISADFYASDFIADKELPRLLEAERGRGLVILGLHINPSRFDRDEILSEYQTVNQPNQPITDLSEADQEKVFDDLARRIEGLAEPAGWSEPSPEPRARLGRIYGDVVRLPPNYLDRVEEIDAIKAKLLSGAGASVGVVGARRGAAIQGMGGVGKTVLAAAVIQDREIRTRFRDGIVWLTLGQTPDVLTLQRRLLAWVAPDKAPPTEVAAGRDTLDTALKSRRWLIVLDDVWRQGDLRAFKVADTPSRLLITTRNEDVVGASGAVPHVLEELTPPAARAFLAMAVGLAEPDLPPAADDVIEECGRLPLALALAGATLADASKDEELWRDVVAALRAADHEQLRAEFDYPYPHPIAAIQASVDFLPPENRAAYLQLAIFPEDVPIPLAPLEKLWGLAGLTLRNRVKLFVDRALARRQDEHTILLHDLEGDFVRKRCHDVPATHEALLRSYRRDNGTFWVDIPDDGYLIDWVPYHLRGAGRGEELRDLLFDLAWLRRKLSVRDVSALIADAALCADDGEVQRLSRALRMSAHVLNRDKRQLTAHLLGRLSKEDGNRTARLLDTACHEIPAGVLVPRGGNHLFDPGPLLQTLEGHTGPVSGAVVLADGARALSWAGGWNSTDHTLRLWDLESGASRVLEGHTAPVTGAVVLADGARALSWSEDSTLRLWDLASGASRALEGYKGLVEGAVVLADGARALSWSEDTLRLWDLASGASRALEGHSAGVDGAVVSADGARALSWAGLRKSRDHTLRLWDLESGASRVLEGHSDWVSGAVMLGDSAHALSWSEDRTLRLWDLASGASRALKGHNGLVEGAVMLGDSARALSWSEDHTLRLWDLASGASRALKGHNGLVEGAVVLADGARALSWSEDHTLRLWDLASGASRALEGHIAGVDGAVVSADGTRALSWSEDTLRLWDLASGASRALEGHSAGVDGAVVLADGARALSWSDDSTLRLWDLTSGASRPLEGHKGHVEGLVVLADGARALSWSQDSTLRLWDLASGASRALKGHKGLVEGAVVLADGARALSWVGRLGFSELRLWDLASGASRALEGHSGVVDGAVVSADGARALSWAGVRKSRDHTLRLWDLTSGASRALEGHNSPVTGAMALADGARALSWSKDGTLRLWDLASGAGQMLERPRRGGAVGEHEWAGDRFERWSSVNGVARRVLKGHSYPFCGAALSANGARALYWSWDGTLRLWDLTSGASRALEGHDRRVFGAVVSADGARALSWSMDGTLRLWDLTSGGSRALKGHKGLVSGAVVSANGARALYWSEDGALRLWDLASNANRALEGHSDEISGAVLLSEGTRALSYSRDGTLRLWDLGSLQELTRFVGDDPLTCCAASKDGRLAVAGDFRGRVLRFDLPA